MLPHTRMGVPYEYTHSYGTSHTRMDIDSRGARSAYAPSTIYGMGQYSYAYRAEQLH